MYVSLIDSIRKKMSSLDLEYEGIEIISGYTGDNTGKLLGMIANDLSEI